MDNLTFRTVLVTFMHRIQGVRILKRREIPLKCEYEIQSIQSSSRPQLRSAVVIDEGFKSSDVSLDQLVGDSNFQLEVNDLGNGFLLGKKFSIHISFDSPLEKLGWSIDSCSVEVQGDEKFDFLKNGCGLDFLDISTSADWFQIGSGNVEIFLNAFELGDSNGAFSMTCEIKLCYASNGLEPDEETYCNLFSQRRCENEFTDFSLSSSDIFMLK
ncbi:Oidioi.mRNA.OKI2018_I69.chr2.g7384.t1.cds [Oikopleura dioica]|uniref:Oidioi.mRNA.OKI2018_I69.chr2.g7384.t1.cds n=1 Tax=Oikopleura dioica TaxID=34765 RepID=A0ABN7T6M7_OIKDI|nr:Oidioi.mRNA.OKI2018_I69.chr2.g7384.t1.cds [Oikopleura dioica]